MLFKLNQNGNFPELNENISLNSYFNIQNGVFSQRSEPEDDYNYVLKSIILHQGNSPNSGHYTCKFKCNIAILFWIVLILLY